MICASALLGVAKCVASIVRTREAVSAKECLRVHHDPHGDDDVGRDDRPTAAAVRVTACGHTHLLVLVLISLVAPDDSMVIMHHRII